MRERPPPPEEELKKTNTELSERLTEARLAAALLPTNANPSSPFQVRLGGQLALCKVSAGKLRAQSGGPRAEPQETLDDFLSIRRGREGWRRLGRLIKEVQLERHQMGQLATGGPPHTHTQP